ncbi:hypothetical protein G7Y89_g15722 [Cudoniella acicularis]|uniref:Glycoside hydrolase 131 catalytic N-terminal domain-containing protein n=1 Tax=Cudoniella acicularis TaxID=354080 RepID=A0A8H4QG33_9HELO|nr:hypothetical protein G7Y89_g15722 [Cudoniella acicularis]
MLSPLPIILLASLLTTAVSAQKCPIQFDGRVPESSTLGTFDTSASPFNPGYVLGANLKWSSVLQFPAVNSSLFDANGTKAVEVTIKYILLPSLPQNFHSTHLS